MVNNLHSVKTSSTGVYIPLYSGLWSDAKRDLWQQVIDAKLRHPNIPFMVAINPNNGPGSSRNAAFVEWIHKLKHAGVQNVLGYVPTNYGRETPNARGEPRDLETLYEVVGRYVNWYPEVRGLMLDEMSNDVEKLSFYHRIGAYAKTMGMTFVKGNPGTFAPEGYISVTDNLSIIEGGEYPSQATLEIRTFNGKYPKSHFSITLHSLPSLDEDFVKMAKRYVGYMYITDDSDSNPYDVLPSYFERLLELLESD